MRHLSFRTTPRSAGHWTKLLALFALLLTASCQSNTKTEEKATTTEKSSATPTAVRLMGNAPVTFIRKNANSPAAKADLLALAKALAIMKGQGMDCDNPLSWYYQGAMHNTPIAGTGALTKNPYCPAYTHGAKPKPGWDGCTHGGGELHFLLWHRLYTAYFERIVRKLSGKADFAMPYWDYTSTQAGYRVMPAVFRDATDSLMVLARYAPLNKGQAIDAWMNPKLDTSLIYDYANFSDFSSNIEQAPHGAMHDYIGFGGQDTLTKHWNRIYQQSVVGGLMGNVPSAGFDPIFWVHHANIDYLWATWAQSLSGKAPNLDSLEAHPWGYLFFNENGDSVRYTVAQAYQAAMNPDYRYDVLAAPTEKLLARAPVQEAKPVVLAATPVGKAIKANTQFAVRLPVAAQRTTLLKGAAPTATANQQRLLLELEVSFVGAPRISYEVYVRNKEAAGALVGRPHLAGIMNFFGAAHKHGAAHQMEGMAMPAGKRIKTFRFDITREVNAGTFDGNLDVEVVPDVPGGTPITIEKMTLLTRAL